MDILCARAAHFTSCIGLIFTSAVGCRLFVVRLFGRENDLANRNNEKEKRSDG